MGFSHYENNYQTNAMVQPVSIVLAALKTSPFMRHKNLLPYVAASIIFFSCSNNGDKKTSETGAITKTENKDTPGSTASTGALIANISVAIGGRDMNGSYPEMECNKVLTTETLMEQ